MPWYKYVIDNGTLHGNFRVSSRDEYYRMYTWYSMQPGKVSLEKMGTKEAAAHEADHVRGAGLHNFDDIMRSHGGNILEDINKAVEGLKARTRVERSAEYRRANMKNVVITLNREHDADMIAHLEGFANKAGYIKALIREDMNRTKE